MTFQIGDTVHTTTGKLYVIQSFWLSSRQGPAATLAPLPSGKKSNAPLTALTLVRTAQLSAAFGYAHASEREGVPAWQRDSDRRSAAYWLTQAEHRNDDSRAALCLGSDRILELEGATS